MCLNFIKFTVGSVVISCQDLWVLRDADMEATQVLTSWRQEQWTASKAHDLHRWDAKMLQNFLKSLELPGGGRGWG
jgi:hypothetical protein